VYGDTDSIFFTFNLEDSQTGEKIVGKKALEITIELAKEAGRLATDICLKAPHDLEYEKTFSPLVLLSKKRYVGMMYEEDPDNGNRKEMGIVLKRRDNADVVKDVYGGIIDILMKDQDFEAAINFLKTSLQEIIDGKIPMEKLIITKALRSNYKNPAQIAHKVLADRIGKRDPGNKPQPGDRVGFVYIKTDNKKALQGEKIETTEYIVDNKLKIDYGHYISNQIMKPVQQVFSLALYDIPDFKKKVMKARRFALEEKQIMGEYELDVANKKVEALRNKEVKALLFDKYLRMINNSDGQSILDFF
jgi:DNA polymerase elongation subunit (family B)